MALRYTKDNTKMGAGTYTKVEEWASMKDK
jgi:hypothetical protein